MPRVNLGESLGDNDIKYCIITMLLIHSEWWDICRVGLEGKASMHDKRGEAFRTTVQCPTS